MKLRGPLETPLVEPTGELSPLKFDQLAPKKNRGGNRTYTQKDIEIVNRINHLRKKEKLTIEGTRAKLTMKKNIP